ncbi:transducin family protein [Cordyceps fumosorosea ARSEF 2679]|uniref:Transducin family protein n=1 Tax=Cordyceps fumosorosea (strain ARSEF 2679) TaxID=1081104 RepID=A0A162LN72_CORFA|nr:transducin family protein [Cordyceps fumosorosea ARSEF 2679]OAA73154.1 transducin family protein [Cordyceps fumosorosea ARSEF 2679]
MSIITAAQWVPRGFAAPFPQKYTLDEAEYERIAELAKLQLDDAEEDLKEAQEKEGDDDHMADKAHAKGGKKSSKSETNYNDDEDLKEYDLDNYDDDEDDKVTEDVQGLSMFGNMKSLAYYEDNKDDPYITLQDGDDEEAEDVQILATDNLILSAKVEDEMAHLEVYVYEDASDNLYVHHDIMLPAIPLAVEWIDMPVSNNGSSAAGADARGNSVAVATMDPDIEIWDLDTIDCMYPNAILGPGAANADPSVVKPKKKKSKASKANDSYHVDAVLALAANRKHRNLLASASADKTVKLWDLHTAKCAASYAHHTDKVCSLAWHAAEPTVLLTGSYDRTVVAADMRAPDAKAPRWGVESDVESVRWNPHDANYFFVATEGGAVHYYDARAAPATPADSKSVWTLQAHDESVSAFDVNPIIPGFIATGSTDRTVKLWNVKDGAGPSMVVSRNLDVGKVFAATFAPDAEVSFRLAVAGSGGSMHVWDTSTNPSVRKAFAERVPEQKGDVEDRLVGVDDDESSSSEEEEEGGVGAEGEEDDEDEDEDEDDDEDMEEA